MEKYKFGVLDIDKSNSKVKYIYPDIWCIEKFPNFERGVIAPSENHIDLILDIVKKFEAPYWILYMLVVSRTGKEIGRYQCPEPVSYMDLKEFCTKYKEYFETDGRHHIWIGSKNTDQLLVYDHHNVIYVYDEVSAIKSYLKDTKYMEQEVKFPVPHTHMYNKDNDKYESDILNYWNWIQFPLQIEDEL